MWIAKAPVVIAHCTYIGYDLAEVAEDNFALSGCWVGYLDIKKASEILNLPDDIVCLFLMPLGYAAEKEEKNEKKSLEELVFYDKWE